MFHALPDHTLPDLEEIPMRKFTQALVNFVNDESGPTAVEYAVMLALIIVVCITAITTLGTNANNTFSYVGTTIGGSGS
jgi:pilus assembly protein Flp/PilA